MITFNTLQNISINEITLTFNQAFNDYLTPLSLTVVQMQNKLQMEGYDSQLSVGAFFEGRLVGFMLHSKRIIQGQMIVYNGGTGVLKSFRGQGLTKRMYEFFFTRCKDYSIQSLQLEVMVKNEIAINNYLSVGFEIVRKLKCYRFQNQISIRCFNTEFEIFEMETNNNLQIPDQILPSWQNQDESLLLLGIDLKILVASKQNRIIGYVKYCPKMSKIFQVNVSPEHWRKGVGSALLQAVIEKAECPYSITNVEDGDSKFDKFLQKNGFEFLLDQYEMKCYLD